jgi:hypothetical protein
MFFLQGNLRTRGFCQEVADGWGLGKVAQIMYTHVSKCKNNKIKILKTLFHTTPTDESVFILLSTTQILPFQ